LRKRGRHNNDWQRVAKFVSNVIREPVDNGVRDDTSGKINVVGNHGTWFAQPNKAHPTSTIPGDTRQCKGVKEMHLSILVGTIADSHSSLEGHTQTA
jgi:hypothetical protein